MKIKRQLAAALAMAMCVTITGGTGEAAAKPKLSTKTLKVTVGSTKTLKVKKAGSSKITWKSNKKSIASVKKAGKYGAKVTGKAKGKAVIRCTVKKGKKPYTLKCNVIVSKKASSKPGAVTAKPTGQPQASQGTPSGSVPTPSDTATQAPPSSTPPARPQNLGTILETYQGMFGYMGSCLSDEQLLDSTTLDFVKKQFNSFTMENAMKPDHILSGYPEQVTKEQAEALGYVVPAGYKDAVVPVLDFESVDRAMMIAKQNGLKMRAHTLVWHSQTPEWFFTTGYEGNETTTPDIMDGRMEFYIRTVMKHVMDKEKELTGEVGSIVYAWDVVNEYLNRSKTGHTWATVYSGEEELKPSFVKKAFQIAYSVLEEYGAQNKVTLFSNDFDTYFHPDQVVSLVNFINQGEKAKICGGIGMQSHVDITRPTLEQYGAALDAFLATGLEVQITELDVTINFDHENETWEYRNKGETDEQQAAFVRDFMKMVVKKQRELNKTMNPKGITGITIWGLYDNVSWRSRCSPLLFKTGINDPKPSYTTFREAFYL